MISTTLGAVLLVAVCVHYGAASEVYTQNSWREPLGSCVSANCHNSTRPLVDMECDRTYTVNGKKIQDTLYLKSSHGYYLYTDENGILTGKVMGIDTQDNITKFTRFDLDGNVEEICCATETRDITPDQQTKLASFCNKEGTVQNDNENC